MEPVLGSSLLGKARDRGLVQYHLTQIRDFATDKHRTVDDTPYGGGEGMVLRADVLYDAWKSAFPGDFPRDGATARDRSITLLTSPQGRTFTQDFAKELARFEKVVLICGHYEGVDERFIDLCVDQEVSIGDYVLTGGELPALVIADAVTRLLPGVVGNEQSIARDTFEAGEGGARLLKYPQYTRPRAFKGLSVPDVLLGGNHEAIAEWRARESRERTARKRPDLLRSRR